MALRILFRPTGLVLSSTIGNIGIETDAESMDVVLKDSDGHILLQERYFSFNGMLTLYCPAAMIEVAMRKESASLSSFTLSASAGEEEDAVSFSVLYCERMSVCADLPLYLSENFLSTHTMRRTAPGATESLYLVAMEGESLAAKVDYVVRRMCDGTLFSGSVTLHEGETATEYGIAQINLTHYEICYAAANGIALSVNDLALVNFSVRCGSRAVSFFVDEALDYNSRFIFRNCFNVPDYIYFRAVTVEKSSVDSSLAVLGGVSKLYDRTSLKEYEVETEALTSDETVFIPQFLASHEVFHYEHDPSSDDEEWVILPVLITDSTCEITNDDDKLNKVKFTWRYADERPVVLLQASRGIFTAPFNPYFC